MKKRLLFIFYILSLYSAVWAQTTNVTITGTIFSSEDNMPLIGASVYVENEELEDQDIRESTLGVITNFDGEFSITIPQNIKNLYCSYIGHETFVLPLVKGKTDYTIQLTPTAQMLDAVVVTGYQTIERRKLTAAVSNVNISEETVGAIKSIDQALAGQIAGLQVTSLSGTPGAPMKIRIRGTSSLQGTQDPLWVLDGIPLEGTDIPEHLDNDITNIKQSSIAGLNPADIDNITVLKDAAATAIYGARAANGVIVITTKNGKIGKPKVSFSTRMTYTPTLSTKRLNLLNSEEKVNLELDLLRNKYNEDNKKGGVYHILDRLDLINAYQESGYEALTDEAKAQLLHLQSQSTDWGKILFRDALNQEYNVNISGGSEKVTYYNSLGFFTEKGNVKGVQADRFNLVSKTSYRINNIVKIGASIFANRRKNKIYLTDKYGMSNPLFYSRKANPYFLPYNEDGGYNYDYDIQNNTDTDLGFNIFEERKNTSSKETINALSSIFDLELRFNDNLKITSQLGLQLDESTKEQIAEENSFTMRDIHKSSQYWDSASSSFKRFIPDGGVHKVNKNSNSQITWKALGEYRNKWNQHEFEIMAGTEIRKNWYETLFTAGYGFDKKTLTTKPVIFPDEEKARQFPLHTKTYRENAFASFFSTTSYSFRNTYTIGGSIRMDGSDLFGVDKKYRYLPLYSVSGLWRISNEPFMKSTDWIDNLAIRASYGLQGNIDKNTSPYLIGSYKVETILPDGSEDMITVNSAPNDKLRWEKTHSINAGIDFSMNNQAINLSLDYYYRKGVDLIGMQTLPLETGFYSNTINWASMTNKGIEIALSTRNITTENFSWYTNFNFAYNANKVLKEKIREDATLPSREGYSVGALFVFETAGLDEDGYILFKNKAGEKVTLKELYRLEDPQWGFPMATSDVTPDEERSFLTHKGSSEPPYTGGFINTFTYKNWELSFNLAFNFGGYVRTTPSYNITDFDKGKNTNKDILNRWTHDNKNTNLPALLAQDYRGDEFYWYMFRPDIYRNLDIWVKKLSYMRLQNLRLGYRLPEKALNKMGVSTASVALEGRNLFVAGASYKNYLDPESMGNPFSAPMPKSIILSLNLSF